MKKVTVFTLSYCPYCDKLKKLLDSENIPYVSYDAETPEGEKAYEPVAKVCKDEAFPTIIVGNKLLVPDKGFNTIDMAFDIIKKMLNNEL